MQYVIRTVRFCANFVGILPIAEKPTLMPCFGTTTGVGVSIDTMNKHFE
jgi:hypothetical protein